MQKADEDGQSADDQTLYVEEVGMVVAQCGCSHQDARRALVRHKGDVIDALLELSAMEVRKCVCV